MSENYISQDLNVSKEDIKPPVELSKPLEIIERQLMTPGPTNVSARVRAATGLPVLNHMDPQFFKVCS
jgi:hypothetical protein